MNEITLLVVFFSNKNKDVSRVAGKGKTEFILLTNNVKSLHLICGRLCKQKKIVFIPSVMVKLGELPFIVTSLREINIFLFSSFRRIVLDSLKMSTNFELILT